MIRNRKVCFNGLRVVACHGVLPFEKEQAQPFIFDGELDVCFDGSDMLSHTVNYAEVMQYVHSYVTENCFDLIETLCVRLLKGILAKFPLVERARLTVYKPEAPVALEFSHVSVTAELSRTVAYLSVGASLGDKRANVDRAIEALNKDENIRVVKVAPYVETKPYGGVAKEEFLNTAVEIQTVYDPHELLDVLHAIERDGNRVRTVRWGDRTIDLDIVFFGNEVICDSVLTVPHRDYKNREFVLKPLAEIAADYIPVGETRTVKQIYADLVARGV